MEYTRICPECQEIIIHISEAGRNFSKKHNKKCRPCIQKEISSRPGVREQRSLNSKNARTGYNFLGKKHTDETKELIRNTNIRNKHIYQTDEFREKISKITKGENNPMFGKSFYDQWVLKYGKELADEKMMLHKSKMSEVSSGSKNPMFNKPIPYRSGIGWKGWYDGEFFRSIHELVFMINMKTAGVRYESAEKISIPWINDKNIRRNYRPDFILTDTNHIVEIKPAALIDLPINKLKHEALVEWCSKNNHSCEIISYKDSELLSDIIPTLIIDGKIMFMSKFEDRVRLKYGISDDIKFVRVEGSYYVL